MKDQLAGWIDRERQTLAAMADDIFDHPEMAYHEEHTSALLEDYLEAHGFAVELGLGSMKTAFRAIWSSGSGGPRIGLLCEYDALSNGHSCGHQMQGPATQTDVRSMAKISATVTYHGRSAHAALKPEDGISALDALLLSFQSI